MKRLKLAGLLLIISLNSFAQEYIKVKKDFKVDSIKIFKGEIFESVKKNQFLFNHDTLDIVKSNYDVLNDISPVENKLALLNKTDNNNYHFNLDILKGISDSIRIINTSENLSINYQNKIYEISEFGKEFRLVMPNYPTVFYTSNEILPSPQKETTTEEPITEPVKPRNGIYAWILYPGLIILIGIIVFLLINRKKIFGKKIPIYRIYKGGSFDAFARNHGIERNELFKMNKNLKEYGKLESNILKQKFKDEFRNKELIVGYGKESSNIDSSSIMETTQVPEIPNNNNNNNNVELEIKLDKMQRNIISEIKMLSSNKEADRKIEELEKKVEQQIDKENQLKNTITELNDGNNLLKTDLEKFSNKVIETEYLVSYTRLVTDFFNVAASCQQMAFETYQKLVLQDVESAAVLGNLLLKFQTNTPLKIGNWAETIKEINENRITTNTHLIKSFKQIEQNEDKVQEFKRIIFKEIIEKYASNILILSEELSKLSKFTNKNSHIIDDCEASFSKLSIELQGKLNVLGFEVNYIPLFQNYEAYAAHILTVNQECSLPFKNMNNIPRETVLEIISYGFGNEKTKIILV